VIDRTRAYITRLKEAREKGIDPVHLITDYSVIFYLMTPDDRVRMARRVKSSVKRLVRKRGLYDDDWALANLIKFQLFSAYMNVFLKYILGVYGVAGTRVLDYYNFVNMIYSKMKNLAFPSWGRILPDIMEEFLRKRGINGEETEILFYLAGITSAKLLYYLECTSEGENEIRGFFNDIIQDLIREQGEVVEDVSKA
jgi:hypothetical protein